MKEEIGVRNEAKWKWWRRRNTAQLNVTEASFSRQKKKKTNKFAKKMC